MRAAFEWVQIPYLRWATGNDQPLVNAPEVGDLVGRAVRCVG